MASPTKADDEFTAGLAALQRKVETLPPEERDGKMQAMMQDMLQDPMRWFKDLNLLRRMEGPDAESHLNDIRQALEDDFAGSGFAVDLGSGSGFIPGEYQVALPSLTFIPTDVPAAQIKEGGSNMSIGMALMEDCLTRLATDHGEKGETERQQLYEKLWARARAVDVLDARWPQVAEFENKCALVICTNILQMKALETPFMWRHILLGAARLLQPRGLLVVKDQAPAGFSDKQVVAKFAIQLGLHLEVHECDGAGLQKVSGAGEYCMFFRKYQEVLLSFPEERDLMPPLLAGHLAEVRGIKAKPELNGLSAVLGKQLENGRWQCRLAVQTEPGMRETREAAFKVENLVQLMPRITKAEAASS